MTTSSLKPWYREPWPWILAAGPFIVVIAGLTTAWIAIKTNDGLVTEDYYKKGLAAHQTIAQSDRAIKAGLSAGIHVTEDRLAISLRAAEASFVMPPTLLVTVSHPTRAGLDQTRLMARTSEKYTADFHLPASGHWLVLVEDEAKSWRLMGNVVLPAQGETIIGGAVPPADIRN
jgi:hypothetical protein